MNILLLREVQRHKTTEDSPIQCSRDEGKIKGRPVYITAPLPGL